MADYYSCALALPPPVDCEYAKYYRVTCFCRQAISREIERQNTMPVLKTGPEGCKNCPMYTDRSKKVHIQNGGFHAELYLDRLVDLPVPKIRQLFRLTLSADWENEAAIAALGTYLGEAVTESKKAWDAASIRFQREWRKIEKPIGRQTKAQIQAQSHNDELTRAVKTCKAQYERWVKIQALWNDTKHKMNFQ